ncbi:little elongation complex subunit 2 isoform X3 [Chionomys nivalis]|uniref:little elongation complex subunit 2 isoform X3 n=1 Tax=Chionomys nivalis TaxID=269649 RepID=UPI002594B5C4|nr:little elongation complex subunit 2 isoform X3 [Chionomys nivalis]
MSSSVTVSEPRLNWDVTPKNGLKVFFSPENYKDHSMAPSLKELYILSNRRIGENLNVSASSVENEPAVSSATQVKEKVGMIFLPKPRVPYPRFSRFSQREQRAYVDLLAKYAKIPSSSKAVGTNTNEFLQYLDMKKHVNEEVNEFLKFLQNSAKKCAQDYNMLSDEARLFTEQILRACIEQVKKYPEFYTLHEVTSLMGFFPFKTEMGLKLEKTLLVLGSAKFVKTSFPSMPVKLQLSKDGISSIETPQQQAEAMHYIPTEANECRKIETLENMDLDFDDDVTELETFGVTTTNSSRSPSSESDSSVPILTDVYTAPKVAAAPVVPATPEVPASPNITEDSRSLCQMLMKQLQKEKQLFSGVESGPEGCKNKDDQGLESCPEEFPSASAKSLVQDNEVHKTSDGISKESDVGMLCTNDKRPSVQGNPDNANRTATASETVETEKGISCGSDTDEDCLIIDTESKSNSDGKTADVGSRPASPNSSAQASVGKQTTTVASEESCVLKKPIKRVYKKFDPVGEILKMQDELLKPVSKKMPELPLINSEESKQPSASEQPSATSDASSWPKSSWPSAFQKPKGRLPYELQDYVEDTSEYIAPQEGNFVYKLFSMQDLLLLVRCSIQRIETRPRSKKRKKIRRQFPVYVLPKVEYQGCYGVEALTESELCRFWTESLLHSNCSFYVGHIDAFTSKLFMLEEITSEELKEKLAALKISSLFNILQHVLKKLCSLQDGSYLLSHAAEDSSLLIYKTSDGKVTRTAYNLHKAHCDLPGIPSSLSVPWVPLDPSYLLPYHIHHGRIPCTFPPKSLRPVAQPKVGGTKIPTHSHRNPVSMETKSSSLPVQQVENEGVAQNKRKIT